MNGVILYKSKYGATKKYAEWISEETAFDMLEVSKAKAADLMKYEVIVLGGGVYASGVAAVDFLKKNYNKLSDKKIIVFCNGASPYDEKAFNEIREKVMTGELKNIPFFYCRGAWNMDSMSFVDKNLCKMLQKAVAKKDPEEWEVWERALMEAGSENKDWTDRKYIQPIIEEINRK